MFLLVFGKLRKRLHAATPLQQRFSRWPTNISEGLHTGTGILKLQAAFAGLSPPGHRLPWPRAAPFPFLRPAPSIVHRSGTISAGCERTWSALWTPWLHVFRAPDDFICFLDTPNNRYLRSKKAEAAGRAAEARSHLEAQDKGLHGVNVEAKTKRQTQTKVLRVMWPADKYEEVLHFLPKTAVVTLKVTTEDR